MSMHQTSHLPALDGWRAISILSVLAAHLLPLGPKALELNAAFALFGMAIFFTLSGFLIVSQLLAKPDIGNFLIRRLFRVVPLAWLYIALCAVVHYSDGTNYAKLALFVANWPTISIDKATAHLWSLCMEMQFYIGIALLAFLFRRSWTLFLPALCILVTGYRVWHGVTAAMNTYFRVDEILAGAILALLYHGRFKAQAARVASRIPLALSLVLFAASCHTAGGEMNYLRPYLAALTVGLTLANCDGRGAVVLASSRWTYLAAISYALYVWHPLLADTWLGSGETLVRYLKRPLLFACIFAIAHFSTYYYEKFWSELGRKWIFRRENPANGPPQLPLV